MTRKRIVALLVIQILTLIIGLAALTLTEIHQISIRRNARYDTCRLLTGLVDASVQHGNAKQRLEVKRYIMNTPLRSCRMYAETDK